MRSLHFGTFLKDLRVKKGLTMLQVAESLGYAKNPAVANFESGKATPPLEKLPDIADLYGVSVDDLLDVLKEEDPRKVAAFETIRRWLFRSISEQHSGARRDAVPDQVAKRVADASAEPSHSGKLEVSELAPREQAAHKRVGKNNRHGQVVPMSIVVARRMDPVEFPSPTARKGRRDGMLCQMPDELALAA